MRSKTLLGVCATATVLTLSQVSFGHPGHGAGGGFGAGVAHPFTGIDHMLVMIAVGLWAVQAGGKALWVLPLTFLAFMAAGGGLAAAGFPLPLVEPGILASVLVMGLLIAAAVKMPLASTAGLVAAFAILHGYAHLSEAGPGASLATYAVGMLIATAILHAVGLGLGLAARSASRRWIQFAGAGVVAGGLMLAFHIL